MKRVVGRYLLLDELASGGMATVHVGRLLGDAGFTRFVAVKVLRSHLSRDPDVRTMFLDEARMASAIHHRNVVQTLDVLEDGGDLFLVMEYVDGVPLSRLMKDVLGRGESIPVPIVVAIICDALSGLEAVHEARTAEGAALHIVHRDVSPQNVMLARDGTALVLDFGVARATDRAHLTQPGEVKGKAAYMAPEQARGSALDHRVDLYAASTIAWELLTGRRLFLGESQAESILKQLELVPAPPSQFRPEVGPALDAAVLRSLAKSPEARFESAVAMREALSAAAPPASRSDVSAYLHAQEAELFAERQQFLERLASASPSAPASPVEDARESELEAPDGSPVPKRAPLMGFAGPVVVAALASLGVGGWFTFAQGTPVSSPERPAVGEPTPHAIESAAPSAPTTMAVVPVPAPSTAPSFAARAIASPRASPPTRPRASVEPSAPPAAPTQPPPLPACCAGGIQIRFSNCINNCPR